MTILIVDDNEQNLYLLQVLLGGNGYEVVDRRQRRRGAGQGAAEPAGPDHQRHPDAGDGRVRPVPRVEEGRAPAGIPFIFYTATYTDERDREFALSLGAERFLVKPEEPEVFLRTIREVIASRSSVAPAAPAPRCRSKRRRKRKPAI